MAAWCCLGDLEAKPHWVPDGQALSCNACGSDFSIARRKHHCRCCGAIFCESCSSGRTKLTGWGVSTPVRVCDDCHKLEVRYLPMLLAGDTWRCGRQRHYLRLSVDQTTLLWAPWHEDEGVDTSAERSAPISYLTCVTEATSGQSALLIVHIGADEKLFFESSSADRVAAWASALARLLAVVRQRKTYENLFGGTDPADSLSPRSRAVSSPRVRDLLQERESLSEEKQQRLKRRSNSSSRSMANMANGSGGSGSSGRSSRTVSGSDSTDASSGGGGTQSVLELAGAVPSPLVPNGHAKARNDHGNGHSNGVHKAHEDRYRNGK